VYYFVISRRIQNKFEQDIVNIYKKLIKIPEAAEVKLTVDFLNKTLKNKKITDWVFSGGRYTEEYPEGYDEFDSALPLTVDEVNCNGKFIYFILSDEDGYNYYILHSLMMTGRWQNSHDEYCKWFVEIDNGQTLWFRDTRAFATVKFTSNEDILQEKLESLGLDIMKPEFKLPEFKKLAQKYSSRNITSFLMDQSVLSGCGNYIKSEVLYDAKVSPLRKVGELKDTELDLIYQALCVIPRVAYNNKGLSLGDYADENGKRGYHERNLKIYSKRWAKRIKTPDGRTTYWDPNHQL
jgi:DNA-formamidopyrimidine glycosylase